MAIEGLSQRVLDLLPRNEAEAERVRRLGERLQQLYDESGYALNHRSSQGNAVQVSFSVQAQAIQRVQRELRADIGSDGQLEVLIQQRQQLAVSLDITQVEGSRGRAQQLSFEFEFSQELSLSVQRRGGAVQQQDPLAFDLAGDGFSTTGVEHGVLFDITGDGRLERTSFVQGDDVFLALDRNQNGRIDSGLELFGDQRGAANGFAELALLDSNQDQVINALDPIFQQLSLFGLDAEGEFEQRSLAEAGISEIDLRYQSSSYALNAYDRVTEQSSFRRADGGLGASADVLLGYRALA